MCLLKVFWNSGMEKYWVLICIFIYLIIQNLPLCHYAKLLDERNHGQLMTITLNLLNLT